MPNFFPRWRQWWRVFCQRCLTTEQPLQTSSSLPLTRFVDVEMKSLIWFENVNIKDANGCLDFCEFLMAAHCITSATPRWYNCSCCCCWFLPLIQFIQQIEDGEFSHRIANWVLNWHFPPREFWLRYFQDKITVSWQSPLYTRTQNKTFKAVRFGKCILCFFLNPT